MSAPTFTSASHASTDGSGNWLYLGGDPSNPSNWVVVPNTQTTLSCAHTVASGDCLLVYAYDVQNISITSMTWNGTLMNYIPVSPWHVGGIFYLDNPEVGSFNITGTWAHASHGLVIQAASFAGVTGIALGASKTLGVNTTISVTNTATTNNTTLVHFCQTGDYSSNPSAATYGAGQTGFQDFMSTFIQALGSPHAGVPSNTASLYQNTASYLTGSAIGVTDTLSVTFDSAGSGIVSVILESEALPPQMQII